MRLVCPFSRQASPPRPTLMVGDLTQCQAALVRLQRQCADLLQGTAGMQTTCCPCLQ